jgi:formylglycine-generating enzyme required for sulfatase activity
VQITRPFYLAVHEVTQAQYVAVMGHNPSWFSANGDGKSKVAGRSTDQHPVEMVSWLDAAHFCNKLSEMEGRKPFYQMNGDEARVPDWHGTGYRLPTEAEWEYACRGDARTPTRYSFGDEAANLGKHGWYGEDYARGTTHPGGQKQPNDFGLFDMHGNVFEWCWDGHDANYYRASPVDDPRGPEHAAHRVVRGGSWGNAPHYVRSAYRSGNAPGSRGDYLGFRVARGDSSG